MRCVGIPEKRRRVSLQTARLSRKRVDARRRPPENPTPWMLLFQQHPWRESRTSGALAVACRVQPERRCAAMPEETIINHNHFNQEDSMRKECKVLIVESAGDTTVSFTDPRGEVRQLHLNEVKTLIVDKLKRLVERLRKSNQTSLARLTNSSLLKSADAEVPGQLVEIPVSMSGHCGVPDRSGEMPIWKCGQLDLLSKTILWGDATLLSEVYDTMEVIVTCPQWMCQRVIWVFNFSHWRSDEVCMPQVPAACSPRSCVV
jgi:hypothetical protein